MYLSVDGSTIHNSQDVEKTYMFTNRGLDKEHVVHIYNRILFSHKKNRITPLAATCMNIKIILSEVKTERDK